MHGLLPRKIWASLTQYYDKEFMDFMIYWKLKGAYLSCLILFGKYLCKTFLTFGCCNTLWNYLEVNYVFWIHWICELLMWLCPCVMMLVITLSWWQQAKLETYTLYDTGKSLSAWMRPLPVGPKDHIQKGYCVTHHSLLPIGGGRGEEVNPWVCG